MIGTMKLAKIGRRPAGPLWLSGIAAGLALFLAAIPLALVINRISAALPGQQEKAIIAIGVIFVLVLATPLAVYLLAARRSADPARIGLIVLATTGVLLVASYLYQVSFWVFYPGDFLIWSETEFVSDILKFRIGYPLYTDQLNNESFIYPPGAPLATYFISTILGNATSITFFRVVQLGYTLGAAAFAFLSFRTLMQLRYKDEDSPPSMPLSFLWLPLLFLVASNSLTNPFAHNLHNDAFGQLLAAAGYFVLVRYAATRDWRLLVFMALIPAAGFMVKQIVAIWAPLFVIYLGLFDRPRSIPRTLAVAIGGFGGIALAVGVGLLIWGGDFQYWIFQAAGNHPVSPVRSFQHVLDTWPYWSVGLIGGFILLRGRFSAQVFGLWAIWLVLFLGEAYTSGIGWMLNHLGPGSLIAGIWLAAGLTRLWNDEMPAMLGKLAPQRWLGYGIALAVVLLLLNGLGMFHLPIRPVSDDSIRYFNEVEAEFRGLPVDRVLLDSGSWYYLDNNTVMKDRVTSIGDRGYGQTGDFSGIIQRLEGKHYDKIMVRNLHLPKFWYESDTWAEPAGIKDAMLANYDEVKVIKGVEDVDRYLLGDVSVLVPKP